MFDEARESLRTTDDVECIATALFSLRYYYY